MEAETKQHLSNRTIWVRILYMVLFTIAFSIAEFLVAVVTVFQAIVVLITGSVNGGLHAFGKNLSIYINDILHFQTFNSEELPFPFTDWPNAAPDDTKWSEVPTEAPVAPAPSSAEVNESEDVAADHEEADSTAASPEDEEPKPS